jgi:hypothetical protein
MGAAPDPAMGMGAPADPAAAAAPAAPDPAAGAPGFNPEGDEDAPATADQSVAEATPETGEGSGDEEVIDVDEYSDGTMDTTYWFVAPGQALKPEVIANYLDKTNSNFDSSFGANVLCPITTKAHTLDDQITNFYRNPTAYKNEFAATEGNEYSHVKFAFRVLSSSSNTFVKNQDIWLQDAYCKANDGTTDALRLYMEGVRKTSTGTENTYTLFNPNSASDSYDVVAGMLDLSGDGYYDYVGSMFDKSQRTELIYGIDNGSIDSSLVHTFTSSDYDGVNAYEYNNINNYADVDENTQFNTFYAQHEVGTKGYVNYDNIDLPKAYYSGTNSIYPVDDHGTLSGGRVLTSTSNDDLAIATLDMTIFLEGWNHCIIDQTIGYYYNLGLTFKINRVE